MIPLETPAAINVGVAGIGGAQMPVPGQEIRSSVDAGRRPRRPRSPVVLRVAPAPGPGSFSTGGTRDRSAGPDALGAEPALDVRLHQPLPQVVIVRVAGTLNRDTAAGLARRVGQQLDRARHVVLDLGEVHDLGVDRVGVLLDLHREATTRGATLHVAGTEHDAVRRPLRRAGSDRLLTLAPCADAVVALLAHPRPAPVR